MKTMILKNASFLALFILAMSPLLFAFEHIQLNTAKSTMLVATIIWFSTSPFWMGRDSD